MLASNCSSDKYLAISDIQGRVINLKSAKSQITDTAIVSAASAADSPIKPNIKLNTIIAAILGLFLGIFAAFGRRLVEGKRRKIIAIGKGRTLMIIPGNDLEIQI